MEEQFAPVHAAGIGQVLLCADMDTHTRQVPGHTMGRANSIVCRAAEHFTCIDELSMTSFSYS